MRDMAADVAEILADPKLAAAIAREAVNSFAHPEDRAYCAALIEAIRGRTA